MIEKTSRAHFDSHLYIVMDSLCAALIGGAKVRVGRYTATARSLELDHIIIREQVKGDDTFEIARALLEKTSFHAVVATLNAMGMP